MPVTDFSQILNNPSLWDDIVFSNNNTPLGHGNPDFLYGVATSMYQDSGAEHCPDSQWRTWEINNPHREKSGVAVDLFALYQTAPLEIIKRLKLLSVNTYRFSLEWSHLEPTQGQFNTAKLQTYIEFCRVLRDHQIQPFITLHHFSEPHWFHELGSFEKAENITYFREFCRLACGPLMQEYHGKPLVEFFCTINEPGIDAYCRYIVGFFSPNRRARFKLAANFLLNMLLAHCEVYTELKKMAAEVNAPTVKIGISHQYLQYYSSNWLLKAVATPVNKLFGAVLSFFKTGVFEYKIPMLCHITKTYSNHDKPKTDFVGLQFYGRCYLGLSGILSKNKPLTAMWGMHEDPEGLYEAIIVAFAAFNVPVLISENGIATDCDEQRARYLSRALYAAEQARQKIGVNNLLGYIMWSFSDNFEWFLGWKPRFGAFPLTEGRVLEENYKAGVEPFVQTVKAWRNSLSSVVESSDVSGVVL